MFNELAYLGGIVREPVKAEVCCLDLSYSLYKAEYLEHRSVF